MKFKFLLVLLLVSLQIANISAQDTQPNREFRGVWVSTVFSLDWPKKTGAEAQKAELIALFDQMKAANLNAILFQVRTECDAFYASTKEPWSRYLTGTQGEDPGYDPLAFAIEEAHKRGLELHAWLNPFRVTASTVLPESAYSVNHISQTKPEWVLDFPNKILNPGIPAVREYITSVVEEIVQNYDVDGIHFDDYFYPYSGITDEDAATFAEFNAGFTDVKDWRRFNINETMRLVNEVIKENKPNVRFGISPFGIWKSGVPEGIVGTSAYDVLYADGVHWLENQIVDYLTPQLYWRIGGQQDFKKLLVWWSEQAFAHGRHLYAGHTLTDITGSGSDASRTNGMRSIALSENHYESFSPKKKGLGNSKVLAQSAREVPNQIAIVRENRPHNALGSVLFRAANIVSNPHGFTDYLKENTYTYPAVPPVMEWLPEDKPAAPGNLTAQVSEATGNYVLSWERSPDNDHDFKRYVLYNLPSPPVAGETPEGTVRALTAQEEMVFSMSELPFGTSYWAVKELSPSNYESDWSNYVTFVNNAMPVLTLPTQLESVTEDKFVRFEWESFTGSIAYHYQFAYDEDFTEILDEDEALAPTANARLFNNLQTGNTYYFRIRAQNELGWSDWSPTYKVSVGSGVTGIQSAVVSKIQVYPNPSKGDLYLQVNIKKPTHLNVELFSADGSTKVAIADGRYTNGEHTIVVNRETIGAGLYFLIAQVDDYRTVQKVIFY